VATSHIEGIRGYAGVVIVTATERGEELFAAVRAGARGIVYKRFAFETLMTAVRAVADGFVWLPPDLQAELIRGEREEPSALTPRERDIVRHVGLGLRNAEVAERLAITEVTVKTHVNNIFHKLGLRARVELALYAIRSGLVAPDERQA